MCGNVIVKKNGYFSSFNGIERNDWWGDLAEMEEFTKENYAYLDFLSELKEEFNRRLDSRNYPPGFYFY